MIGIWETKRNRLLFVVVDQAAARAFLKKGRRQCEVPDDYDASRYDFDQGKFVAHDRGKKAAVDEYYGAAHIAQAHALKAFEAQAYTTSFPNGYYPLLQAEADARGIAIDVLAERVLQKHQAFIDLEIRRVLQTPIEPK